MAEERRGSHHDDALVYGLLASGILFAMKPSVYVETSAISCLASRPARDLIVAARQELTREWWEERSGRFELVISELVEQEAGAGDPAASRSRLAALEGIAMLALSDAAVSLAERLVDEGPVPREAAGYACPVICTPEELLEG